MQVVSVVSELPENFEKDTWYAEIGVSEVTNKDGKVIMRTDTSFFLNGKKKVIPRKDPLHFSMRHLNPNFASLINKSTLWKDLPETKKLPLIDGTVFEFENNTYTWAGRYFYLSDRPGLSLTFVVLATPTDEADEGADYKIGEIYKSVDLKKNVSNLGHVLIDGCMVIPGRALFYRKSTAEFECLKPEILSTLNVCWMLKIQPAPYISIADAVNPLKQIDKVKGLRTTVDQIIHRMGPRDRISVWSKDNYFLLRLTPNKELAQSPFTTRVIPTKIPQLFKVEVEDDDFDELVKDLVTPATTFEIEADDGTIVIVTNSSGGVLCWMLYGDELYRIESVN